MKQQKPTTPLIAATIVSAILVGLFLSPFFAVIASAVILAYSFLPLHKAISRKVKRESSAAMLTFLAACAIVIVPIVVVLSITVSQAAVLTQEIRASNFSLQSEGGLEGLIDDAINWVEGLSGGSIQLTQEDVTSYGATIISEAASAVGGAAANLATSVPAFFSGLILFVYLFLALLVYYRQLIAFMRRINPLDDHVFDMYVTKARAMTDGMVKGQFLIALAQGAIGAISFAIAGVPYVAFFFVALSFLSIIPLGSGIISFPVGAVLLLTGNIWQGLLILLVHIIVVGNIDNLLRPILIPEEARLPSALLLLGVFSGLYWFGFLGLFVGPIFLILGLTTMQVYAIAREGSRNKRTQTGKKPTPTRR